jgi:hypothetical protein
LDGRSRRSRSPLRFALFILLLLSFIQSLILDHLLLADVPVPGFGTRSTNNIRCWSARGKVSFDLAKFNEGNYDGAVREAEEAETISTSNFLLFIFFSHTMTTPPPISSRPLPEREFRRRQGSPSQAAVPLGRSLFPVFLSFWNSVLTLLQSYRPPPPFTTSAAASASFSVRGLNLPTTTPSSSTILTPFSPFPSSSLVRILRLSPFPLDLKMTRTLVAYPRRRRRAGLGRCLDRREEGPFFPAYFHLSNRH